MLRKLIDWIAQLLWGNIRSQRGWTFVDDAGKQHRFENRRLWMMFNKRRSVFGVSNNGRGR